MNNTTLQDITNRDVTVFITSSGSTVDSVDCRTFEKDGALWVDCIPRFNGKYAAPIPDDAMISRNEIELSVGRYGLFVRPDTELGTLILKLLQLKEQHHRAS